MLEGDVYMSNRKTKGRGIRITVTVLSALALFVLSAISAAAIYINVNGLDMELELSVFDNVGADTVSRLYYFDENGVAHELDEKLYGSQITVFADIGTIPENLQNAFIAVEDKRFYRHSGVDLYRTAGATANYIFGFSGSFGASTITQQLIKNATGNNEYSINRKIQEMIYAADLEKQMSKEEILELYLNIINLSQGCYGVGAAAQKYFSKDVSSLELIECAAIAAITQNPSKYDPINNPKNNAKRRDTVLSLMYDQGYITASEYEENVGKELVLNVDKSTSGVNSWYADMVVSDVIDDLVSELGYSEAAASLLVYSGGLRIYTAMDPDVQAAVEEYFLNAENFPADDRENGRCAMIIINPYNGNILGVAGAIGEKCGNRLQNYATDTLRPSGSVIKPLSVYAPALEEGKITWSSVFDDVPIEFTEDADGGYKTWPNNATLVYSGLANIKNAVQNSLNTVSVRVLYELGAEKSYEYLKNGFGLDSLTDSDKGVASLALGQQSYGLPLREITAAYSAFANNGECTEPRSYVFVQTRDGEVLLSKDIGTKRVISEENASVMTKLLESVTEIHGTVTLDNVMDTAGKTGTTQNTCDRWFVGYTPYYVAGVWYGHDYPETLPDSAKSICTTVWNAVMTEIHDGKEYKSFDTPPDLIKASYCKDSGKLMTAACLADPRGSRTEEGWFVDGTQPREFCDRHVMVDYDTVSGGVSLGHCPEDRVTQIGLILVDRIFPMQIKVTDAQYVYKELPDNILPYAGSDGAFFATLFDDEEYCGISGSESQYNRCCPDHGT